LRFSSFADPFRIYTLKEVLQRISFPVTVDENKLYYQIGIRSHSKGIFYKEAESGKQIGNKRIFWIEPNCLILNIVFAWEQAVAKTSEKEVGMVASHRFPMYKVLNNSLDYIVDFFKTEKGKQLLQMASPGGAGRNKTLNQDFFLSSKIYLPSLTEQLKTSELIELIEDRIETQIKIIDTLSSQKKQIRNLIFKDIHKNANCCIQDYVIYEQPQKYIVHSTDYLSYGKDYTPVLTANQSFILGYTLEKDGIYEKGDCIIFDDFTNENKYVDFPFKVKSSALKILQTKEGIMLKFFYEYLQFLNFESTDHKRHYLSEVAVTDISVPNLKEQTFVCKIFTSFDNKLKNEEALLEKYRLQKQFFLNNLFI
jgi:type I restriction enzyme S subunit